MSDSIKKSNEVDDKGVHFSTTEQHFDGGIYHYADLNIHRVEEINIKAEKTSTGFVLQIQGKTKVSSESRPEITFYINLFTGKEAVVRNNIPKINKKDYKQHGLLSDLPSRKVSSIAGE